jgi:hypothetical protein
MTSLQALIVVSGILHLGTLLGSAQVPKELKFREELPKLNPLLRHWVLVAGGYIVFNIISFGIISLTLHRELCSGSPLARAFCGYVSLFWAIRLFIQLALFDARPYLTRTFLRFGYHGLTIVFLWQTLVYGYAAVH